MVTSQGKGGFFGSLEDLWKKKEKDGPERFSISCRAGRNFPNIPSGRKK